MKTMLNIKTDVILKKKAQDLAKELGLPLSVILNNYLKEFINTQKVTFEKPLVPNTRTKKVLNQALKDIREGNEEAFSPTFDDVDEAMTWLNN